MRGSIFKIDGCHLFFPEPTVENDYDISYIFEHRDEIADFIKESNKLIEGITHKAPDAYEALFGHKNPDDETYTMSEAFQMLDEMRKERFSDFIAKTNVIGFPFTNSDGLLYAIDKQYEIVMTLDL